MSTKKKKDPEMQENIQENVAETVHPIKEIIRHAGDLFPEYSIDIVNAAFYDAEGTEITISEAKKTVKAFAEKEV